MSSDRYGKTRKALAHEIWAVAQLAPGEGIVDGVDRIVSLLRREGYPAAITHCDNCGCDWLDNGLNPVGCPYCEKIDWRAVNTELLPLPVGEASSFGDYEVHDNEAMIEYARANIARAVAPLQAEIEALRAEVEMLRKVLKEADNELDWLDEEVDTCDHSVGVCMCDYWNMRREMKAALSRESSNEQ